jgi:hypothetical protein
MLVGDALPICRTERKGRGTTHRLPQSSGPPQGQTERLAMLVPAAQGWPELPICR